MVCIMGPMDIHSAYIQVVFKYEEQQAFVLDGDGKCYIDPEKLRALMEIGPLKDSNTAYLARAIMAVAGLDNSPAPPPGFLRRE